MAKLEDIASLLRVDIKLPSKQSSNQNITTGKKRRPWLDENDTKSPNTEKMGRNNPKDSSQTTKQNQTGFIDLVNKPNQTGFIDPVDQSGGKGSINPISEKGLINPSVECLINLENLRGNPLKVIVFLSAIIEDQKQRITKKTSLSEIMKNNDICRDSAKTALRFLCKNKVLTKEGFKGGVNGWSRYSINERIYFAILQKFQKGLINPVSETGFNCSSNINIINTITEINPFSSWEDVDVSLLANIGFNKNHLLQLKTKNTPQIVQESINHFAFGLQNNQKTKEYKDPVSVLIGVLRKGEAWIDAAYKTPHEIAMEKILIAKTAENERIKKTEEELKSIVYENWFSSLSEEELLLLCPATEIPNTIPEKIQKALRRKKAKELSQDYFAVNIWPEKLVEIKQGKAE